MLVTLTLTLIFIAWINEKNSKNILSNQNKTFKYEELNTIKWNIYKKYMFSNLMFYNDFTRFIFFMINKNGYIWVVKKNPKYFILLYWMNQAPIIISLWKKHSLLLFVWFFLLYRCLSAEYFIHYIFIYIYIKGWV
jgi:hypothetical protein